MSAMRNDLPASPTHVYAHQTARVCPLLRVRSPFTKVPSRINQNPTTCETIGRKLCPTERAAESEAHGDLKLVHQEGSVSHRPGTSARVTEQSDILALE